MSEHDEERAALAAFEAVIEHASDGHALFDEDGRIRWANRMMAERLGYAPDALRGLAVWDIDPRFPAERYRALFARGRDARLPAFASIHRRHDGTTFPVEVTAAVVALPSGVRLFATVRDVTERTEAEAERERLLRALEVERSRLATVFAQTPSVLAIVRGPDHVLELANEAYLALNGYRVVLGKPLLEAVPELRGQGFDRLLDRVRETGEPYVGREVPIWLAMSAGAAPEERFFDFVYLPLVEPDETGAPTRVGVIAHGNDITEQVRARREIERARERADRLQRLTAALAATTTPEAVADVVVAQLVDATGAATGVLALRAPPPDDGAPPEAMIYRERGVSRETLAEYARFPVTAPGPAAYCLRTGQAVFVESGAEVRARFPEIPHLWNAMGTEAIATVPLVVGGDTVGAMSLSWTAPRRFPPEVREFFLALGGQAAQALERARLFEAERAVRAAAEVAQDRAEAAGREAEAANQAKSGFLAVMSHELRTPINAMIGYTQLLELGLAGPLTDQQRAYLERLSASSQHLLGLVNDVLDLSKIEAGETRVAQEDATTGPAVRAALDLVRPQASARGVRLVDGREDDVGVPYVGDDDRTRQIVLNLLGNAVKFTPRGGTVTVTSGTDRATPAVPLPFPGEGAWAFIRVADTGVGIPAAEHGRIFEPFHQVDGRHTRAEGGTGLGLAISRRLARLMGGDLTVESTPEVGSTFTLWLPSARPEGAEPGVARPGPRGREATPLPADRVGEVAAALRASIDQVIAAYGDRLHADPAIPRGSVLPRAAREDHAVTLLTDLAQLLAFVHDAGPEAPGLLRDSGAIQRTLAEAHGARRHAQGWDEAALQRDHAILREEVERAVRARLRLADGAGRDPDVEAGVRVLLQLLDRVEAISLRAWRRAAHAAVGERAVDG